MKQVYIDFLRKLSVEDKEEIVSMLNNDLIVAKSENKLLEVSLNNTTCPHCQSTNVIKKGGKGDSKRFYCKDCHKWYTLKTNSIFAYSKKRTNLWYQYIDLMCKKFTIREIAKELHINIKTSFLWRHKILMALSAIKANKLSGIVEADETYFRESQKGNRSLIREAHKSGKSKLNRFQIRAFTGMSEEEYKQTRLKRGLSNNQVCVLTALDRNNNIIGKPAGFGKMRSEYLKVIKSKISKKSTLITDGEPLYATLNVAKHKRLEHGLSKDKVYNIGRTDELHTSMKGLINGTFRGVATKYLDNYVNYVGMLKMGILRFDKMLNCNIHIKRDALRYKVAF